MAVHSIHSDRSHRPDSMRLAESALLLSDKSPDRQTFQNRSLLSSEARPLRPTIFTDTTRSPPETFRLTNLDEARSDLSTSSLERHSPMNPDQKLSRAVTDGPIVSSRRGLDRSSFSRPRSRSPLSNSDNTQTSPPLRSNTVPVPSQHSSQTLPPIQSQFPSPNASKSPKNTESLPSIEQSNLKDLLNSRLPTDSRFTDLNRTQAPVTSSLSSPTQSTKSVKPPTQSYPSPKTRIGSAFPVVYTHGQPSPVPSDASPRELGAMSPPDKPGVPPFAQINRNKSPVLNDELTPQSANSYPSSTSFSTVTSPQAPDPMDVDRAGRVLPPLVPHPGPPVMSGSFKCEYSGCTAAPFQTQYLLNSHANVHSQKRPHYCPVPGCNRGEGGKGFKRKNEMIRHGLVHESPGYICPFCPEREHKYPRPDNLQRHVRVNHVGKDMNDPQLREVLSQRLEGANRSRRRRVGS